MRSSGSLTSSWKRSSCPKGLVIGCSKNRAVPNLEEMCEQTEKRVCDRKPRIYANGFLQIMSQDSL
jgi:hypothetical protein